MELKKVFEPGKIGNLELKNRLVVSAMSSHMGNPDGTPNETVNAYLVAKVKGGWGLIFTEDLGITADAGSDPVVGSLWNADQVRRRSDGRAALPRRPSALPQGLRHVPRRPVGAQRARCPLCPARSDRGGDPRARRRVRRSRRESEKVRL